MATIDFLVSEDGFETVSVFDMGEGCLVLTQAGDEGAQLATIAMSWEQLSLTVATLEDRYGSKNTDRRIAA